MPNFVLDLLCMKNHINILIREYFPNREEMPDFLLKADDKLSMTEKNSLG